MALSITPGIFIKNAASLLNWQLHRTRRKTICSSLLSNQALHRRRFREGPAVLIGDGTVHIALKEGEHRKPDAGSPTLLVRPSIGQSVVVQEESGSDIEGYKHINGVVFMGSQDEEDPKEVEDPRQGVDKVPTPWSV